MKILMIVIAMGSALWFTDAAGAQDEFYRGKTLRIVVGFSAGGGAFDQRRSGDAAMKRYDCLKIVAQEIGEGLVITTVGGAAAEWNSIRPGDGNLRCRTLGLVSSVAMGLALALPNRRIIGFDGDGALLMNACGLPTLGWQNPANLTLLVFDNGIYEASGLRRTATSAGADLMAMARGAGVKSAAWASSLEEFRTMLRAGFGSRSVSMIGVKTESGDDYFKTWQQLPSFEYSEVENLYRFMRHVEKLEGRRIVPLPGPRH